MRRAPDSDACHRAYLEHLLSEAGGVRGWRSSTSVLIAAPQGHGWLVDDFAVDTKEGGDRRTRPLERVRRPLC
jgi:hypothetical protein